MRTFVNVTHVSLDGVMERMEDWHFDYVTHPDHDRHFWETIKGCDTLLMGRVSYQVFAEAWPQRTGPAAEHLNAMQKILISTTVTEPTWGPVTVWSDDVAGRLRALKSEDGGGVITYGFGPIAKTMLDEGLLDDLYLGVNPTFAGKGDLKYMLIREGAQARFDLAGVEPLGSGVVISHLRPAG